MYSCYYGAYFTIILLLSVFHNSKKQLGTVAWHCSREVCRPYMARMAGQKSLQAVYGP